MNIKSNECVGFQAHSINPQRCRRCYKDINEHRRQSNPSNLSPISERKSSLKSRSSNVSIIPEKHSSLPLSSFTTKPGTVALREVETKNQNVIVENSEEKNEEGEEDEEEEEEEEAEEEEEEEEDSGKKSSQPVNVTFTVRVRKSIDDPERILKLDCTKMEENQDKKENDNKRSSFANHKKELGDKLGKFKIKNNLLESISDESERSMQNLSGSIVPKSSTPPSSASSSKTNDNLKNREENINGGKWKQKIDDLEREMIQLRTEKKLLEDRLEKFASNHSTTVTSIGSSGGGHQNDTIKELRNKLIQSEKIIKELTRENEEIKKDVKELEIEFQELHDNFREDQSSEFRVIKHELEAMTKNCRILQFKLKKSERTIEQLENEKFDLRKKNQELFETSQLDVDKKRMKELENELAIAKEVSLKLHAEIESLKEERCLIDINGDGIAGVDRRIDDTIDNNDDSNRQNLREQLKRSDSNRSGGNNSLRPNIGRLSPSSSFDQSVKDYEKVVRDLYDTMEREKDLQEQLKFSEEETRTIRKKLSTMEQENEILMLQIRKMTSKNRQGKANDEDESDELDPEEMKLHLDLYEQEMIVLRRKTDELEQENDNFQQEIKYLQDKLVSQMVPKIEMPEIPPGSPPNVIYEHKIKILETEVREFQKKLIDKERENESLRTENEMQRQRSTKVINRSRSLETEAQTLDMKKQLQLFEQEAQILRQKMIDLENENEKLSAENKRLQLRVSKKQTPLGSIDQLQIDKIELNEKNRELERKCEMLKNDLINRKLNEASETETEFIANLKRQLRTKDDDLANQSSKIARLDIELSKLNREYKKLKDSLSPRRRIPKVIRETATRLELKEIIKELEDDMEHLQTILRGKEVLIENLNEEITEMRTSNNANQDGIERKQSDPNGIGSDLVNLGQQTSDDVGGTQLIDLRRKLIEEQHRSRSLQDRLDKINKSTAPEKNLENSDDSSEALKIEKKNLEIKIEDLEVELEKSRTKCTELVEKLKVFTKNNEQLNTVNGKLKEQLEEFEDRLERTQKELRAKERNEKDLSDRINETRKEMERQQQNHSLNKLDTGVSKTTSNEFQQTRKKLEDSERTIKELHEQIFTMKNEQKQKDARQKEEFAAKMEQNSKNIRKEVHNELQQLREDVTISRNRSQELQSKLDRAEKESKELNERLRQQSNSNRKEQNDLQERIEQLEEQLNREQRKKDRLEKDLENANRNKEEELMKSQEKIIHLERETRRYQAKIDDLEFDYTNRLGTTEKELNKLRQDYDELKGKNQIVERDFVDLKSRSITEKETLVEAIDTLKKSYEEKLSEIKTSRERFLSAQKEWYQEKLKFQERIADLESRLNKFNLIEEERNRLKQLIQEKENLLNSYRKEERTHNEDQKRNRIKIDSLQNRIAELEKVERNQRFLSITGRSQVDKELQNYKIRLEHSETSHKGELAAVHAEYEGRMKLLGEEVEHLQQQIAALTDERDQFRDQLEQFNKEKEKKLFKGSFRDEIEDLNSQLRIVRSDLEGALLENRNLKIQHGTERSTWQIQLAEYKTQINQLEERILLETRGSTRTYARTKMELAWEKERQENQRLLQETQKFIQELRDKLIGTESLREKERDEAHKNLLELKTNMDREHVETQRKIAQLQLDLLALKEVHARLRSQNERYKKERLAFDQAKMEFIGTEMAELHKISDHINNSQSTTTPSSLKTPSLLSPSSISSSSTSNTVDNNSQQAIQLINQLERRLQIKYQEMLQESRYGSLLSVKSVSGLMSSSSQILPTPSQFKRAPPRLKLGKKSISLDQQLQGTSSQDRIWDSDQSLNSTPNSSISNLRYGGNRYGYAGYESDSSGSSFYGPNHLRPDLVRDRSVGSDSDASAISTNADSKKIGSGLALKERFKVKRSSKSSSITSDDENLKQLKTKLALSAFDKSPIELAKQREKKQKSLRYKISKTLSKTFSRSASILPEVSAANDGSLSTSGGHHHSKSNRTKSPTRTKIFDQSKKLQESLETVPGIAQLKKRPQQSNLAIPPSRQSPPKIRIRAETNV